MFGDCYFNKTVFITGHTGFKGSWLALWLQHLGAKVVGYALEPPTNPNHFELLNLDVVSIIADIRDRARLSDVVKTYAPEIVFHLSAQPIVRYSYINPVQTFETNIIGTVNIFEACRSADSVRAIVNITSDKCYENKEWVWGYRENDPMGGYDPYSASKGCAEIITGSYRNSFFNPNEYGKKHNLLLASARAGNVIGGGDWADSRLIPDIIRAVSRGERVAIRYPKATRPWQHVLEPLSGYLLLGQMLLEGRREFADGWNFGPDDESNITVEDVVRCIKKSWDKIQYEAVTNEHNPHEAGMLKLDCSKARLRLKWKPLWDIKRSIEATTLWYKEYLENDRISSYKDLTDYVEDAKKNKLSWAL